MYDIAADGLKLVSKPLFGRGSLECLFFVVIIVVEVRYNLIMYKTQL